MANYNGGKYSVFSTNKKTEHLVGKHTCNEGSSWGPEGHREPYEDFDYSKLDGALGWAERGSPEVAHYEDAVEMATEGFSLFLAWVWLTPQGKARNPDSAKLRFLAATATLRPAIFDNKSFAQIASGMGLTRAALSKLSVEFADEFSLHFRCQKRSSARAKYAKQARENSHWKK